MWGGRGHRSEQCAGGKQKKKYDGCFICGDQEHKVANCPKHWKEESRNESVLLTRAAIAAMGSRNTSLGICETWTADSGTTSTMASSSEGFLYYTVRPEGRYVETANGKLLPVAGCGQLAIVAE